MMKLTLFGLFHTWGACYLPVHLVWAMITVAIYSWELLLEHSLTCKVFLGLIPCPTKTRMPAYLHVAAHGVQASASDWKCRHVCGTCLDLALPIPPYYNLHTGAPILVPQKVSRIISYRSPSPKLSWWNTTTFAVFTRVSIRTFFETDEGPFFLGCLTKAIHITTHCNTSTARTLLIRCISDLTDPFPISLAQPSLSMFDLESAIYIFQWIIFFLSLASLPHLSFVMLS